MDVARQAPPAWDLSENTGVACQALLQVVFKSQDQTTSPAAPVALHLQVGSSAGHWALTISRVMEIPNLLYEDTVMG